MSEPLAVGSLFAGIGGLDLGLERAGMRTVWQVEKDEYARKVLAKHWPDVRRHDDVCTFPPGDPDDWRCDLVCGGFPCQDISYAGKGAGLEGARSGLWYEFARVVRELRPRYVLVENVAALLVRGLDAVLGTLASLGYDAEWSSLSACSVGSAHTRERVFVVAYPHCLHGEKGMGIFTNRAVEDECRSRSSVTGTWLQAVTESAGKPYGFPSGLDADRRRVLGNAVVPQVAEWIGRRIIGHAAHPGGGDAFRPGRGCDVDAARGAPRDGREGA